MTTTARATKAIKRAPRPRAAKTIHKGIIEFGLFAPYNEVVQLIGNWNDWQPIEMTKDDDGWWRASVDLKDGDYQYKFRVKSLSYFALGEMLDVFDPYALAVTDEDNEAAILRVRNGERFDFEYQWQHDDVPLAPNRDLVIYELHVGDFSGPGKGQFKHVIEKLDYLQSLGINCIELMPVKEFPGKGWGYSLRSLFAVENTYGPPEDLCRLIDEAHGRGMRVIMDGVYNHANADSPLAKIAYEYWFHRNNPDGPDMDWGPKFDYHHYDEKHDVFPARKYVNESIHFWVERFHIDGIRFDATRAIKDFDVMHELVKVAYDTIGGIKPFITVAEHCAEDPAIVGCNSGPMDAAWHDSFGKLLQAIVIRQERDGNKPDDLEALATKINPATNGYGQAERVINFITNHDYKRLMHMLGEDAKVFDDPAFRRVKLGFGLLLTVPGIPMIWMGAEFGFASDKSLEPRPLDWSLLDNELNRDLLEHVKRFTKIRHENAALRGDSVEVVLKDHERQLFAFKRWNDAGNVVLVVANLKDEPAGAFAIENVGLEDGAWRDAIHGNEVHVEGGVLSDVLDASEVKVFVKV